MTKKRNLAAAGFLVGIVCLSLAFALRMSPLAAHIGFTKDRFDLLREGMTKDEISAILGVPPGDYTGGNGDYRRVAFFVDGTWQTLDGCGVPNAEHLDHCWCDSDGMIDVFFDDHGKLRDKMYWHAWPLRGNRPLTVWERIIRLIWK